jgi:hypothetical protein
MNPPLFVFLPIKQNAVKNRFCRRHIRKEAINVELFSRLEKTLLEAHSLKFLCDAITVATIGFPDIGLQGFAPRKVTGDV